MFLLAFSFRIVKSQDLDFAYVGLVKCYLAYCIGFGCLGLEIDKNFIEIKLSSFAVSEQSRQSFRNLQRLLSKYGRTTVRTVATNLTIPR